MRLCYLVSVLALSMLFVAADSMAQNPDWAGEWSGHIEIPGSPLALQIELRQVEGKWQGTMDIPAQFIDDMNLDELRIWGDSISFRLLKVPGNARFEGVVQSDEQRISGTFYQSGFQLPMRLQRKSYLEQASKAARLASLADTLRQLADSLRRLAGVPALGFGVLFEDSILLAEGFGMADVEAGLPATADTRFAIGSCTKAFTATCLAMLADGGLLDWQTPIVQYMPDFKLYDPFATQEMTAEDLLTHRSGLPRHDYVWYGSKATREELFQRLAHLRPSRSFRTAFQYQNLMYMTAGILVERLSGMSWEEFVERRIFQPLGMRNADCSVREMMACADWARPYRKVEPDSLERITPRNIDAVGPAGSIDASVNDMLKWVRFQLSLGRSADSTLVSQQEILNCQAPHQLVGGAMAARIAGPGISYLSYGLGWFNYDYKGKRVIQHGGNIDGYAALVFMVPEARIGMVVLTNLGGTPLPTVLAHTTADILLQRQPTDWYGLVFGNEAPADDGLPATGRAPRFRIENTRPQHSPGKYVGNYSNPGYGQMEVFFQGDSLALRFNEFTMPLRHWHYETFHADGGKTAPDLYITFYTNPDGKVRSFTTSLEAETPDLVFERIPPPILSDPAFMQKLTGAYELQGMAVTIRLKGGKLIASVPGQPDYVLEPYDGTQYRLKGLSGYSVEFIFDEEGRATRLKVYQPEGVFTAVRK